uniref:Zinc ribbon domain-containing protein n=1 Tax=Streptomyces sp. NBC_01401 TaxID=2903854 RepID=A0AAU3H235_9ACTN
MDYCHPCQRHLNGALACAGCGTPADALDPYAAATPSDGTEEPATETLEASGSAGHRRRARSDTGRRRKGHRRRGRALLLTAAGVVLALGALSLAELAMEPGGDSGASEYVREATSAPTEPAPSASSRTEPDGPGAVDEPTVVPVTESRSATAAADAERSTAPAEPPSSSAPAASPSASAPRTVPTDPGDTDPPAEPSGSGKPTADPTSPEPSDDPDPEPTPSPSDDCWWIFCV